MTSPGAETRSWFRPRVSLRNLFLLMTLVALVIADRQSRQANVSMGAEITRLRIELDLLLIDDPSQAYIKFIPISFGPSVHVRNRTPIEHFRVYFPPKHRFRFRFAAGEFPDMPSLIKSGAQGTTGASSVTSAEAAKKERAAWFENVISSCKVTDLNAAELLGEFKLKVILRDLDGQAFLTLESGGEFQIVPSADWISENRSIYNAQGDVGGGTTTIDSNERFVLMHLRQRAGKERAAAKIPAEENAKSLVLWIESATTE